MRMRQLVFFIATLFCVSCATLQSSADEGKRWAVVVGIDDYRRTSVTDLKCAVNDARLFAGALTEVQGFSPERVFVFTTDTEDSQLRPRLTNLVYRLESLRDSISESDSLYFYFAGHGVEMDGETFLLTENADNRSRATLTMSALRADLLLELLQACNARETLIVLDACRNDPMAGRGSEDNRMSDTMSRGLVFSARQADNTMQKSLATLMACGVGERSYEWPEKQHGYFTYHLVEGLKSGASDPDGKVSLAGLSQYVRERVSHDAKQAGQAQHPSLKYEGPGPDHWILARTQTPRGTPENDPMAELERLRKENALLRTENARLKSELEGNHNSP